MTVRWTLLPGPLDYYVVGGRIHDPNWYAGRKGPQPFSEFSINDNIDSMWIGDHVFLFSPTCLPKKSAVNSL
jgi:hypothetical protein